MSRGSAPMRVLQVTASNGSGGADAVAARLTEGLRARGHDVWLAVGHRASPGRDVLAIPHDEAGETWARRGYGRLYDSLRHHGGRRPGSGAGLLARLLRRATHAEARAAWWTGLEDFDFPGTARLLDLPPAQPDLVHGHNLHGGYFDLRQLGPLSTRLPVCLTLHDAWLLSGHCAHAFACDRWRTGCGACPDLTIEPAVRRDRTAENWRRKQAIYASSRLHLATPSRWLMDRVQASMLAPAIASARVIANGIDTTTFAPGDRHAARASLGLPVEAAVILVTTGAPGAPWRDTRLLVEALDRVLSLPGQPPHILAAGHAAFALGAVPPRVAANVTALGQVPPARMATAYQAADVYVHAARTDTFPTTVIEALASGVPVVATRVGGIPEQLHAAPVTVFAGADDTGRVAGTGVLVEPGDAVAMAAAIAGLLERPTLRRSLGEQAVADARARFSLAAQVRAYEDWYCAILSAQHAA